MYKKCYIYVCNYVYTHMYVYIVTYIYVMHANIHIDTSMHTYIHAIYTCIHYGMRTGWTFSTGHWFRVLCIVSVAQRFFTWVGRMPNMETSSRDVWQSVTEGVGSQNWLKIVWHTLWMAPNPVLSMRPVSEWFYYSGYFSVNSSKMCNGLFAYLKSDKTQNITSSDNKLCTKVTLGLHLCFHTATATL